MENYYNAEMEIERSILDIDSDRWVYYMFDVYGLHVPYGWDSRWFYVPGEEYAEHIPEYAETFVLAPVGEPVITLDYIVKHAYRCRAA